MERTTIFNRFNIAAAGALAAVLTVGAAGGATAAGDRQDGAQQGQPGGTSPQLGQSRPQGTVGGALMGGAPQTCPGFVERDIHGPQAIEYSWGVSIQSVDGPQKDYTREELARLGCDIRGLTGR